jgi:hypothetical protein
MRFKLILLVIIALAASVQAQEPKTREVNNDEPTVMNDDRGRAFVIERESPLLSGITNHGREPISAPEQYSIFLGRGWAAHSMRSRQAALANLLNSVRDDATLKALNEAGVTNLFGPTSNREQLDDLAGTISDLEIQTVLSRMLTEGTVAQPNANTIYVVFLDPELHSTIGGMMAGKHYAAYHNFFNAAGTRLHYVVVPFEADRKVANQIAFRALVAAALNPTGTSSN